MRIRAVEISHCAEDESGNITHVILDVTMSDGSGRVLEVRLPSPDALAVPPHAREPHNSGTGEGE